MRRVDGLAGLLNYSKARRLFFFRPPYTGAKDPILRIPLRALLPMAQAMEQRLHFDVKNLLTFENFFHFDYLLKLTFIRDLKSGGNI